MKTIIKICVAIILYPICITGYAQKKAPIEKGEKAAITYFDFNTSAGFFDKQSLRIDTTKPKTLDNSTLYYFLAQAEQMLNKKYGIELEKSNFNPNAEDNDIVHPFIPFECFPRIRTEKAMASGYDKIIEINFLLRPSTPPRNMAEMGSMPNMAVLDVNMPKPTYVMVIRIKDKTGKQLKKIRVKVKGDRRLNATIMGIKNIMPGMSGKDLTDLYDELMAKALKSK